MRVLIANFSIDPVSGGGTAQRTLGLCRALHDAGIDVALLTTHAAPPPAATPGVAPADRLIARAMFSRFPVPLLAPRRLLRLVRSVDVVFILNHWTMLNVLAYAAARIAGRPFMLCPAGAMPATGRSLRRKRWFTRLIGERMVRDAALIVATTRLEARELAAAGVPAARLTVIPNGFDPAWEPAADPQAFRQRQRLGAAPFVLFLGRLHWSKGLDTLLDAFAAVTPSHPDWRLVLAGHDHGARPELEARAARPDLRGRVHFTGPLSRTESMSACAAAALLVLPSRRETMSIVALEAAALGTPAMVSEAVGFDEVAQVGGGRVVPGTVEGLRDGLRDLLARPGDLPAMGDRLRAFTVQTFAWPRVAALHVAAFDAAIAAHARRPEPIRVD